MTADATDGPAAPEEPDEITVRQATSADRPAMIELCRSALGWKPEDPSEAFFAWKHDENPFGPSPAWLAEAAGELVGVRIFMRWGFRQGAARMSAVRAVDTATRPDMQGRGVFRRLTLGALPDLAASGVDLVFNTPNDKSRPGYLKMGWQVVGQVPVAVRIASPASARRVLGAKATAEKWSRPTSVGRSATAAFEDRGGVERLLALADRRRSADLIRTDLTVDHLRWRYSFEALHYRAVPLGDRTEDGLVVFRLRRRGTALEATICEVLDPSGRGVGRAVGWILRHTGADYAIACDGPGILRSGFVPAPKLGPVLTWRPLDDQVVPQRATLALALGDVELF